MTELSLPPQPDARVVRLLDADSDFARAIPAAERELADRALTVRELHVHAGGRVRCDPQEAVGLLLLEGAVWREVHVRNGTAPQLLAPGAVVLCEPADDGLLLPVSLSALTLQDARFALLDRRWLVAAARWPRLASILHARLAAQERDLAALAAIGQLPRVDDRLLALLWHLAERWGRMGAEGVTLPLRLTHATLGRFVGARRPTVSLALAELRAAGVAVRRDDGTWLLAGTRPETAAPPATVLPDLFVPEYAA